MQYQHRYTINAWGVSPYIHIAKARGFTALGGKKIIGITFEFDYKDREQRKEQNKKKAIHQLGVRIVKPLEKLKGKTLDHMVNGETKEIVYRGQFTIDEDKQEVIAVFEEMPQRKRYTLTLKTPEDIQKLKTMQKQHAYRLTSKNKKLILADKDGSGLVFSQQIQENLKKRKEKPKAIEKPTPPLLEKPKPTPIENKTTQKAIKQKAPTHKICKFHEKRSRQSFSTTPHQRRST